MLVLNYFFLILRATEAPVTLDKEIMFPLVFVAGADPEIVYIFFFNIEIKGIFFFKI